MNRTPSPEGRRSIPGPSRQAVPPHPQSGTPRPAPERIPTGAPQRRPLPPEEIARRRAIAKQQAILRARRARRRRRFFAFTLGLILLILLLLCIRACRQEDVPVSTEPVTEESTPAVTTEAPPPETEPVFTPSVRRPTATTATVTLTDEIDSEYAVLVRLSDATILASKQGTAKIHPASMTKVMSLIVAFEHLTDLTETFTVTSTIIDPLYREGATLAGFAPGETVSMQDLLYGMILPSGAEASVALAIRIAGSEEAFVDLMNEKAKEIGLTATHFTNCTGLHGGEHYSTPVEIAMILAYAMQYPKCAEILSAYQYTTAPTEKHPEGILLTSTAFSRMYGNEPEGVTILAGKTGYTHEAHHCLVSYATDDVTGEAYVFTSAGAQQKFEPVFDAIEVYSTYTK